MCRKSVSLIGAPQGPDDHHGELHLTFCSILYDKELKTKDGYAVRMSQPARVAVHRQQAQNWNLPARQHSIPGEKRDCRFVLRHLHNLGWCPSPGNWVGLRDRAGLGWTPPGWCPSLSCLFNLYRLVGSSWGLNPQSNPMTVAQPSGFGDHVKVTKYLGPPCWGTQQKPPFWESSLLGTIAWSSATGPWSPDGRRGDLGGRGSAT